VGIVVLLARHIRLLMSVKRGLDQGLSGSRLAAAAQVPPYFLDNYVMQSRLWTTKKLEQTLVTLSETDKALKSSPLSSHIWLENLVLKTCSSSAQASL
jgi:DNA polymerase-3 subunit delta